MLSKKEKQEMLADGKSVKRRKEFARIKQTTSTKSNALDDFLGFLRGFQKIFPSPSAPSKKISARHNKL